jgi:hypothetical protein
MALLLPATIGALPAVGRADDPTPVRTLALTETGADLFFQGSSKSVRETAADGTKTTETEQFLEEALDVRGKGYIYHPNLLEWYGSLRLGLTQEQLTINQQSERPNGKLLGYNISGLFLREKPISLSLFSSRSQQFIDRDFASRTDLQYGRSGIQVIKKGDYPMSLLLERVDVREDSGLRLDQRTTNLLEFRASDQSNPNRLLQLTYDHEATDETVTTRPQLGGTTTVDRLPFIRDELDLASTLYFGPSDLQNRFTAHARLLNRTGSYPETTEEFDASLELMHSDTLSTFYRILYLSDQTDIDINRTFNGEAGITKHIYESLDITGRLVTNDQQFQQGLEDTVGGFLEFAYRKKTPIGRLESSLLIGEEVTQEQSATGRFSIHGELLPLSGLGYIPLSHTNVMAGSVVIMNQTRTITFIEGVDYLLRVTGAVTEIARLAAGGITDGQVLLVDYTVLAAKNATWTTDQLNWTTRLQLEKVPVAFYYGFHLRNDNLQSGDNPGNLDKQQGHLVGVELSPGDLRVILEHEIRNQLLYPPWTADRVRASYLWRPTRDIDVSVGAGAEHLVYSRAGSFALEPGQSTLDTLNAYGRLTAKLRSDLLFHTEAEFMKTSGRENRNLAQVSLGLDWHYRDLDLSVQAREAVYQQEQNQGSLQSIMLLVKRRF